MTSGRWQRYLAAAMNQHAAPADVHFRQSMCRVFAASDFIADSCIRDPELPRRLLDSGDLLADSWPGALAERVRREVELCTDEVSLYRSLRQLRRREMLRIAWRDIAGWSDLDETLTDLSDLADTCIQSALAKLGEWQAAETPVPRDSAGRPLSLIVLAMGKLGARELNFSSDIDLIFAYPDAADSPRRGALSAEEYFSRLGQSLIQALSHPDQDGFVFRVDMRLRPYGEAGALACSFEALEEYYQSQGRDWERYAMIKARPVTGEADRRQELEELLRPFVFRRYLDYRAFDSLRDLKQQIGREVARKGRKGNLKLGPGGIREIEFIAQAFQLVRGGREPRLRQRGAVVVLEALAELGLLPAAASRELVEAYRFLRRAENRLQAMHDQQVHHLPETELERERLALAMQFSDWESFCTALQIHQRHVEHHFAQVFAVADAGPAPLLDSLKTVWLGQSGSREDVEQTLRQAGYDDPAEAWRLIEQLRTGNAPRYLGEQGRARFDALIPMLLSAVGEQADSAQVLGRLVSIFEQIAGRTTYLALLQESPQVLNQLVKLCAASAWIADQISRFPLLLDQLLDPRTLYAPLQREELEAELEQRLRGIDANDLEQQMDGLRQFRHAMILRVAAADVADAIPLMVVSDRLTVIAEVVVQKVLSLAWKEMSGRYGVPRCKVAGKQRQVAFIVVAYGKFGGIELGYGSDLDLVFLHDSEGDNQKTSGRKSVDNSVFLTRLGQRMIHMLETMTAAGVLYEVDMRLRPSGNAGLLVSSLEAFNDYQREAAWTWEHQALVRARVVAGDQSLAAAFEKVRDSVLSLPRKAGQLRLEVLQMRERMRTELGSRGREGFHLKQDPGGIVDIEFMVQYLVLRWCKSHPDLSRYTDTIRLLETLAEVGRLSLTDAQVLVSAYKEYRALNHRLTLAERSALVSGDTLSDVRDRVIAVWRRVMEV
ncbi:MAG: bifunctional [glutamate--ammonia ligase]-adenylyl-L-tyrosine phosphorylase/[glutamate--ammonia-ligase] adenylyltransferase [Thiogranum sp.]|nr:bifunctional [glutamate--ammonia ligase]-adenylyl-L-tyrosine phosphorylase/[glutamate--ammonia-ligase] adenylyltransferase [Thiogranum sp.]